MEELYANTEIEIIKKIKTKGICIFKNYIDKEKLKLIENEMDNILHIFKSNLDKNVNKHIPDSFRKLIDEGRLSPDSVTLKGKRVTFHDPCYLGRGNGEYESPRDIIKKLGVNLIEMKRTKSKALCCGAGGAQMFKEPEKGNEDINIKRSEEAIKTDSKIVAVSCPFCNTMMSDGMTSKQKDIDVLDVAQMIEKAEDL